VALKLHYIYASMLNEETIGFLIKVPPFNKLSGEELDMISEDIMLEYYPDGVKTHSVSDSSVVSEVPAFSPGLRGHNFEGPGTGRENLKRG